MRRPPILARAADVVQINGLARKAYIDSEDPEQPAAQCRVCPRAAIAIAAEQHPLFAVDWPQHCTVLTGYDGEPGSPAERDALAEIRTAETAFARYLRSEQGASGPDDGALIETWADEPGRTLPQVVGALRAAAEGQAVIGR